MNKFIQEELNKISHLDIEKISDTEFILPMQNGLKPPFEIDKCYLIEVANYILNPPANFTLQDNWNNGLIPKDKYIII